MCLNCDSMNSFVTRFANMLDTDTSLESSVLSESYYMDCNEFNVSHKFARNSSVFYTSTVEVWQRNLKVCMN